MHGTELKRIGRYLLGTTYKGTIVRPTDELIVIVTRILNKLDYFHHQIQMIQLL
jgi:hypothetical protein